MYCMKCGKETAEQEVFCESCLQTMAKYPIKPGTPLHLPKRDPSKKPATRKRPPSPEEQIAQLRQTVRRLLAAVAVLTLALLIATAMLVYDARMPDNAPLIGKNYTIDTSHEP